MSTAASTITGLLEFGAPDSSALGMPGGVPLTYRALRALASATIAALNARGIGRNDRVAIVLDNGPEMAAAFLAVGAGATAAPLNPGYRADEFEFYLTDLKARLLVAGPDMSSPAVEVAKRLGIAVVRLVPAPANGAGSFALEFPAGMGTRTAQMPGAAEPEDVALVLHTSGTTSRPKIVPLSQRNVCASARNIGRSTAFGPADRGLNIMPLFHIHGLIAGILAPLSAGGEVSCTPGFNALKFFSWMAEVRPTWYTGVPTMHQAILSRASKNLEVIEASTLRFIRSSSSSLPPQVLKEVEETFNVPLIEAYGMTEAAHQMASNPLPPGRRKPGTVGLAAGPEVGIIDTQGDVLAPGNVGEIAIRGENVMAGYENNPKANAEAYAGSWFRTGDQGIMDADGYVTITGRLKEIINRGGEKISPREVDEVLMDHPSIQQCVTFAIPHDKLGEEVAAAVVLREGAAASEKDLRAFVAIRLADYKVPRKIVILAEIPKGATGKLQRIGLAQKLGLA
ncbi:MAG: acyl--CoA ligase [Betaproteobacteria bacterium]|jgi:acyl-CoA synthetase (AMP-forming)/AMP-acid ligase II